MAFEPKPTPSLLDSRSEREKLHRHLQPRTQDSLSIHLSTGGLSCWKGQDFSIYLPVSNYLLLKPSSEQVWQSLRLPSFTQSTLLGQRLYLGHNPKGFNRFALPYEETSQETETAASSYHAPTSKWICLSEKTMFTIVPTHNTVQNEVESLPHTIYKNSKQIKSERARNIKRKHKSNLSELGFDNGFLDMTSKTLETKKNKQT